MEQNFIATVEELGEKACICSANHTLTHVCRRNSEKIVSMGSSQTQHVQSRTERECALFFVVTIHLKRVMNRIVTGDMKGIHYKYVNRLRRVVRKRETQIFRAKTGLHLPKMWLIV